MIDKSTSDNIKMLGVVMTAAIVMYHCGATASSNAGGGTVDLWLNDHVSIAFNQIGVFAMSYFFYSDGIPFLLGAFLGKNSIKDQEEGQDAPYSICRVGDHRNLLLCCDRKNIFL